MASFFVFVFALAALYLGAAVCAYFFPINFDPTEGE